MEPHLHLRCLGEPVLTGTDGEPIRFKVRKHLALLVYLAVESRVRHHRDHLANLLWGNLPDADGRHSLATALSMLRTKVGVVVIEGERDHVRFNCPHLKLDLQRLETGDVLASEFQPVLEIVGFLEGFEIPGASEFMIWRERKRARWLPLVREALTKRIDKCRRTGDFKQIEHLADRMFDLDELSEEAVRAKMEARAFAGDRLTALKVFEAWKERLHEELGAAPSALVDGMALRLRHRDWERPNASPIAPVHTDQWKNRPFVGRAAEYQALYEAWERCRQGEPGHTIILGDSGIGKSTLANRLATAAGLEGAVTSRVQCYELEREIPYATITGLVQGLLDCPGASATRPSALAEMSRTVPAVRQKFPSIPQPTDSQGEAARILLTEAFHEFLTALTGEQPVILVVDDLHLADDASLAVLHLMMRRARGEAIMVVFASRVEGLDRSPQAARLRESAERLGLRTVELARMSEDESSELLTSFILDDGEQPGPAAKRALIRASAGYPMVLELLVQDWRSNGERSLALSVEAMTAVARMELGPVESYRQLLDRITNSLDPATRNVLYMAAILGSRLNDMQAYELAGLSVGQTMAGLGTLIATRVLRERGTGLEFVNELIRAHAYFSVPSPMRRSLHAEIAGQLLEQHAKGEACSGLEIAWHCFRGERQKDGIPHLLAGARRAMDDGGPHEVELALVTAMPALVGTDKEDAQLLLADAMQEQGRWIDSLVVLDGVQCIDRARPNGLYEVLSIAAHLKLLDIGTDNIDDVLQRLERIARERSDINLRTRALAVAAFVLQTFQETERAGHFLLLAAEFPRPLTDINAEIRFLCAHAVLASVAGEPDARLKDLVITVEQLELTPILNSAAAQLLQCSAAVRCGQGNYQIALQHAAEAHRISVRLGNDMAAAAAAANIALCHGRLGSYAEQVLWSRLAQKYLGPTFTGYRDVMVGSCCGFGNAMLGQYAAALTAIEETEARIPSSVPGWMRQAWDFSRADVLHLCGKSRAAADHARRGLASGELFSTAFAGAYARWLALTSAGTPKAALAADQLERFRAQLYNYDAIDQAQILAACELVAENNREASEGQREKNRTQLEQILTRLPRPVRNQFQRLGIMPQATPALTSKARSRAKRPS